jgi:hypothetical protein
VVESQFALPQRYEQHAGWLGRRSDSRELVDSALHDTFVPLWHSAVSYRGRGDVGVWLWRASRFAG